MTEVVIRFIQGKEINVKANKNLTVGKLKKNISSKEKIHGEISLIFQGQILSDETKILSLDNIANSFIICHVKHDKTTQPERLANDFSALQFYRVPFLSPLLALRREQFLRRQERVIPPDPPNFNELVQGLIEMGFEEQLCKNALRMSNFNQQVAVTMLLNGNVPSVLPQAPIIPSLADLMPSNQISHENEENHHETESQLQESNIMHSQNSQRYPELPFQEPDLPITQERFNLNDPNSENEEEEDEDDEEDSEEDESNSELGNMYYDAFNEESESEYFEGNSNSSENDQHQQQNDTNEQQNHEKPPNENENTQEQNNGLPEFTDAEKNDINELKELTGFDFNTVARIYLVCHKNVQLASQCFLN